METIIKKAIEGRYKPFIDEKVRKRFEIESGYCVIFYTKVNVRRKYLSDMVLDPLFWGALGKASGWGNEMYATEVEKKEIAKMTSITSPSFIQPLKKVISGPLYYALKFYEINLTEGWEKAVEWLQKLINPIK